MTRSPSRNECDCSFAYVHVILLKGPFLHYLPAPSLLPSLPLIRRAINYSRVCTVPARSPALRPNRYMYRKSARVFANAIKREDTRGRERGQEVGGGRERRGNHTKAKQGRSHSFFLRCQCHEGEAYSYSPLRKPPLCEQINTWCKCLEQQLRESRNLCSIN